MDFSVAVVAGALLGLLGCVAPAALFERALRGGASPSLASGIVAVGASFVSLAVVLFVVYTATDTGFLEFGSSMVASMLLFWAVEAVRGWRAANRGR